MRILDRAIVTRFLGNFVLLFALLFVFATAIDVILQLDVYVAAADAVVKRGQSSGRIAALAWVLFQFHGPRAFQFFQFMAGLLAVGAMGFTFAQMHRARELVAIMAAGVPLRRCVWAVLACALGINLLQLANQELVMPLFAEQLLISQREIGREGGGTFEVPLTCDTSGNLLHATRFDPLTGRITGFLAFERDDAGLLVRRITAKAATWDAAGHRWALEEGSAVAREASADPSAAAPAVPSALDAWATDLSPKSLIARHHRLFAQMLSSSELRSIADAGAIDHSQATRMQMGRIGLVFVNLLVLAIGIPFYLRRGPASMLQVSIMCAATCVPALIVSAVIMAAPVAGLPPAVSVALPIAVLIPAAVGRIAWLPS
jgi:lipopolysaccharide export LptBFGC system permease protein LptF